MQAFNVVHSLIRWAVLIFGILTVINAITGIKNKRAYSASDNTYNLLFMVFCDIQLLIGLLLLYFNHWFDKLNGGIGELMKNRYDRFFLIEHGLIMIIAWILVHIGRVAVKKAAPEKKHKKMLIYFGIALLLILISIPWPFRAEIGKSLFIWIK
ncbi:MAG: hypothetical protein FGM46_09615 [Ferruginibacter sp.]|nr:hypothetical protein [Ferruginibacter sp.]